MIKGTMVLEGGATRGVFTSGVLDYLMEKELYFSHIIGVSAGCCNGVDYVSKQIGRTRDCMIHKEKENNYYYGITKILRKRSFVDMDMVFDKFPREVYPFDYPTYFASDMECEIVTTNCITGNAEYMTENSSFHRLMKICRASSSMPFISPIVTVDRIPYLDGGLADSIPIQRALTKGNEKIIVILTRNADYRKKNTSRSILKLYEHFYKEYPKLAYTAVNRSENYNESLELVEQLEAEGKIFVLRPLIPTISRLEKKYNSLIAFYQHGYQTMKEQYDNLMMYLQK